MVLAGYETTANGLIFAFYLLAKHPDIQEKLRNHIKEEGHKHPYVEMVRISKNMIWFLRIFLHDDCSV